MKTKRRKEETESQPQQRNVYLSMMEKAIRTLAYRHSVYTVFDDFVEMAALSLSNAVDVAQRAKREERYLQVVKRYTKDEMEQFPALLGMLVDALEYELSDVLGVLYHRLEIHNEQAGQFFTPYPVCLMMAKMLVHDAKHRVEEQGFMRAQEPCVGSGAMVIALAQACREAGVHYQRELHVTAIDISVTAVHMAYIQLFLLHIPAVVVRGDTLRGAMYEEWYTAAHVLDLWQWKLRRAAREKTASTASAAPEAQAAEGAEPPPVSEPVMAESIPEPVTPSVAVGTQLSLF